MRRCKCLFLVPALLAVAIVVKGADAPLYNEKADARRDIRAATAEAGRAKKNVVLIFGANW